MRIFVQDLAFVGHHGVYDEERRDGRRFEVDLVVEVPDRRDGAADEVDETVDYRGLAEAVTAVGRGEPLKLVETMAERICARLFERFESVRAVEVTIRKYATGVPGDPRWVGVSLTRQRG